MSDFTKDLTEGIMSAIAAGHTNIVLWGLNAECLRVLSTLNASGLLPHLSAVIDNRPSMFEREFFGQRVLPASAVTGVEIGILAITSDREKEYALEEYLRHDSRLPTVIIAGSANYEFDDPVFADLVASCPVKSKAAGYPHMLVHIYQCLKHIAALGLAGDVAEFGMFQGGTTVFMAKVLQHYGHGAKIYAFDTFSGFPQRGSALDLFADRRYEFPDYATVARYCAPYNIEIVRGDIRQTYTRLTEISLVLSFFDTDNYSATRAALPLCATQTLPGGFLAFDHFYSPTWQQTLGERMAARQVVSDDTFFNLHGTGVFIKK